MSYVTSKDGTTIAYRRAGTGPAVILVGGAVTDHAENAPLALELAKHFTVFNYDRRGRGGSGDTPPFATAREKEDLDALIAEAGGSAHVFGVSSGGALALEAAAAGSAIDKLAVYEVPYDFSEGGTARARAYVEKLDALLAEGRRGDAFELFMRSAGAADDVVAARRSPQWPALEAIAHTLAYDAAFYCNPSTARLAEITCRTLIAAGEVAFFRDAADRIAETIPGAERRTLEGQGHVADPKILASMLRTFFSK